MPVLEGSSGDEAARALVESACVVSAFSRLLAEKLVLLEETASENTKDRFSALCEGRKVPLRLVPEVGRAIGREGHVVMAVTDTGFANMIRDAVASETEVGG